MPGWLIRIENSQTPLLLWRLPIAAPLLLLLFTFVAGFILRRAPLRGSCDRDVAEENAGNQFPAQDEKPATQLEPSKESDCLSEHTSERYSPLEEVHAPLQQEPESNRPNPAQGFGSADRDDSRCLTKLVPIPSGNSPVEATGNLGQEPPAENSGESGPLPETLEVCWFEPCDHCETDQPLSEEKSECARLSDEDEGFGGERSPESGHPLSITG